MKSFWNETLKCILSIHVKNYKKIFFFFFQICKWKLSKKFFKKIILKWREMGRKSNSKKSLSGGRWGGSQPPKSLSGGRWGGFSLPFERVSLPLVLNEFEFELFRMKIWSVFNQPMKKINQNNIFSLSKKFNKNVTLKFGSTILNWRLVGRIFFGYPPRPPAK